VFEVWIWWFHPVKRCVVFQRYHNERSRMPVTFLVWCGLISLGSNRRGLRLEMSTNA
jgi:hypothetical protein